jgi:hypothetical protein
LQGIRSRKRQEEDSMEMITDNAIIFKIGVEK